MDNHIYPYIAGLIDGEGTIGIRRYGSGDKFNTIHYVPMVEIGNTNKEVIDFVANIFNNSSNFEKHNALKMKGGVFYVFRITGNKCKPLLINILPFLIIKKEQAINCLNMCNRLGKQGCKFPKELREHEQKARYELYVKFRTLNNTLHILYNHKPLPLY
jgi:hypothetical protein